MAEETSLCSCMTADEGNGVSSIEALALIRSRCAALHSVFLPDEVWANFAAWHAEPDRVAAHRSMLMLALKGGHLARLTGPIHRYLLEDGKLRSDARHQYVKDLREKWMLCSEPLKRHQLSRVFTGRVTEFQCAEWLERQSWTIANLEALGARHDIEAKAPAGILTAFEVKSIGIRDEEFQMILRSMKEGPSGGPVPTYSGINYLLLRVYEAAKQLRRFDGARVAIAVIDDVAWSGFDLQLQDHWLDWAHPAFFEGNETWETFLGQEMNRWCPNVRIELASVVQGIDRVWIVRRSNDDYQFHLEYEFP